MVHDVHNKKNSGNSGANMFFTKNNEYILKTIKEKEMKFLLTKVLKAYHTHVNNNSESILCQFRGLYSIGNYRIIIMKSILTKTVSETFDLKGSVYNREV